MKGSMMLAVAFLQMQGAYAQVFNRTQLPTNLYTPWEITYGPDGFLWLSESNGRVSRVDPAGGAKTVVYTAPDYYPGSPLETWPLCFNPSIGAGTLGLALHPDFPSPAGPYIYFVYSYNSGTDSLPDTRFRIKRLTWDSATAAVTADTNLVDSITSGYDHFGGRLLAVKQGNVPYLFLTVGDHGVSETNSPTCYQPQSANPNNYTQDPFSQNGKVHRFNMDGSIPAGNPIPGNPFYTRGHRNPQGLIWNPVPGVLYDVEHGDRTDDEINILIPGMNYGWKDVRGYHNDNNYPGEASYIANYVPHPSVPNDSLVEAFYSWCDTIPDTSAMSANWCTVAPSDGIWYGSPGIPGWSNSLLVVTLKDGLTVQRCIYRFKLQPNGQLEPSLPGDPNPKQFFAADHAINGRLRDITVSPDGKTIYLINNGDLPGPDRITVYTYDSVASGLAERGAVLRLEVFPNPAGDEITVRLPGPSSGPYLYGILSVDGRPVAEGRLYRSRIDVSPLAAGVYFIRIEGMTKGFGRFVKR